MHKLLTFPLHYRQGEGDPPLLHRGAPGAAAGAEHIEEDSTAQLYILLQWRKQYSTTHYIFLL